MVPETGNAAEYARFSWTALGRGAIGFAPFGSDAKGYSNCPLGAEQLDDATVDAFASKYALFAPMDRTWASISLNHETGGVAKGADGADQSTTMERCNVTAQLDLWAFGEREWNLPGNPAPSVGQAVGGAVVAQLGADEFVVAGNNVRVRFNPASPEESLFATHVEEGDFSDAPTLLRVVLSPIGGRPSTDGESLVARRLVSRLSQSVTSTA